MRILILTQYYPPESGAPQNRLSDLAVRFKSLGAHVEVLTALPNYPQMKIYPGYEGKKQCVEWIEGIKVHRTSIYIPQKKTITQRLRNYFSFVQSSYRYGKKLESFDFILCESPPLFLGYSAMKLSKKLKAKLIFNVSDLWPESAEKLNVVNNKFLLNLAYRLEAKCYNRSVLISGQTQGIVNDIKQRFPEKDVFWLPNGVNTELFENIENGKLSYRNKWGVPQDHALFFYGGIIGHAQGLEVILHAAKEVQNNGEISFVLLGDGPEKAALQELKNELSLENVFFIDPVDRLEMPAILNEIDASIVPLRKLDLFKGAIPSKIFESLALEKPVLLGVDGEAKKLFVEQGKAALFFEPENVKALVGLIEKIASNPELCKDLGAKGKVYVSENFNREKIAEKFYQKIIGLMAE